MEIQKIKSSENVLIAIVIPSSYNNSGINFLTFPDSTLQLAIISSEKGYEVPKHYHPEYNRIICKTMECIFVKYGKLRINFYDNKNEYIGNYLARNGDVVLFMNGGHSIEYMQKSEIIEIRQGPYYKERDKINFNI